MKLQLQRAFLSYSFFSHQKKNNKETDRLCMKFSSTIYTSLQRHLNPLSPNQFNFCYPFIFEYLNPQVSINQMVKLVSTGHILERQSMHVAWTDRVYYSQQTRRWRWNPTFWSVKKNENRHCVWVPHAIGV